MSKNNIVDLRPIEQEAGTCVFELRSYLVMLVADVAEVILTSEEKIPVLNGVADDVRIHQRRQRPRATAIFRWSHGHPPSGPRVVEVVRPRVRSGRHHR